MGCCGPPLDVGSQGVVLERAFPSSRGPHPLKDTDANLEHVLEACDVALVEQAAKLKQGEPPPGWAMMAVHVDDCPGVASSQRMVDLIIGGIQDSTSAHTDAGRRSSASVSTRTTRKARSLCRAS